MTTKMQPIYTDCRNCGTCDHRDYRCPCGCHEYRAPSSSTYALRLPRTVR